MSQVIEPILLDSTGQAIIQELQNIANALNSNSTPVLPSEYQKVEYLDFTPSIGIVVTIPTQTALYTVEFSIDTIRSSNDAFGYRLASTTGKDFEFRTVNSSIEFYIRDSSNGILLSEGGTISTGEKISISAILKKPRSTALIGKYSYNYSSSGVDPLALDGRVYSLKGIDILTNTPIAWFIPCYRKNDNVVGFYDCVAKQFYYETYHVGSGYSIVAGPSVN